MNTERSALFLMANLGSEVARFLSALEGGDRILAEGALGRAKEILSKLSALDEMKPRQPELAILEDVITDFASQPRRYAVRSEEIRNYFAPFALRMVEQAEG